MTIYDEIARIRVNEAIQEGLQAQHEKRNLPRSRKPISKAAFILIFLGLSLAFIIGSYLIVGDMSGFTEQTPIAIVELINPSR